MAPETPKGVSSRLLTMKFMQRAIASGPSSGSPESETHSSKKRKLNDSSLSGSVGAKFDQASVDAALQSQEAKRRAALQQHSSGDTHWVLDTKLENTKASKPAKAPLNIVYVGYGDIDSSNEDGDGEDAPTKGRTSTRKAKPSGNQPASEKQTEDDSADEESDDSDDSSPKRKDQNRQPDSRSQSRSQSHSRYATSSEAAKAKEFRNKRKKKDISLNKLTSISSGGDNQTGSPKAQNMTCYNCQQPGHRATDCPRRSTGARGRKP